MAFEDVMMVVSHFATATDALAAIGAKLSLVEEGTKVDPRLSAALDSVIEAAGVSGLEQLTHPQRAMALGVIRIYLREADAVMQDPGREPGWTFTDPVVLEGWGLGSMVMPGLIAGALPELGTVRSFLDVGVGVGWLAVAAAGVWPEATIVGIDIWEASLARARVNVAQSGPESRITLRNQDVTSLDDVDAYDCAWLPSFFLPEELLPAAVERVVTAVRPGGAVVVGRFEPVPDPLGQATSVLRTVRAGGCPASAERVCELLAAAGCSVIRPLERTWPIPIQFILGEP